MVVDASFKGNTAEEIEAARTLAIAKFGPDGEYDSFIQGHALNPVMVLILTEFMEARTQPCSKCDWPKIVARAIERCETYLAGTFRPTL